MRMRAPGVAIIGMDGLIKKLNKIPVVTESAVEKALTVVTLDLQGKAQLLAPVRYGDLRGSAFTVVGNKQSSPTPDTDTSSQRLGLPKAKDLEAYVGFAEPYALRQHEEVNYNHPKGGQAKFLEQPFKENQSQYLSYIKGTIKGALQRLGGGSV